MHDNPIAEFSTNTGSGCKNTLPMRAFVVKYGLLKRVQYARFTCFTRVPRVYRLIFVYSGLKTLGYSTP